MTPPPYRAERDAATGERNSAEIAAYTPRIADAVGAQVDRGRFCVVLGGDCSVLLGGALALRRRGRYGLLFVDGHLDFRHPGNTALMSAAVGEELVLVTGRGAVALANLEGLRPSVPDGDVWAIGDREHDPASADIYRTEIHVVDLPDVRAPGDPGCAVQRAINGSIGNRVDGFWIHFDVDVLDSTLMPAVDSPQPDGLTFTELVELLRVAVASPSAVGLEVTISDPDLDPDGSLAKQLTDALVAGPTDA